MATKTNAESDPAFAEALGRIEACRSSKSTHLSLEGLGLSDNQIYALAPELGQLTALTALNLGGNRISVLPPELGQLTALTLLYLNDNEISVLPPELGQLTALTVLYLSRNQISVLPPELGQLTALTVLALYDNQISALPPELGQLTALTVLALYGNQISALPPELGQLTALTGLYLGGNQISVLPPELGQLTALNVLALYRNQISALPPELGQLTALTALDLYGNQLSDLPPELGRLAALTELDLYGNQISVLPPELGQLTALVELDLRENRLTSLPDGLAGLTRLKSLMVSGNPLPAELLKLSGGRDGKGTKLLKFWRSRAGGITTSGEQTATRRFDEAKLLLVGPGNVGKTWLLRALQGHVPKKIESTKGIEIAREPLEVPHPADADRTLHLTCWDFGGQDHYQITHQIFFSAKAVYLLVWMPRKGFDPEMEARLERIQLSAGDSAKVLIVSTHADGSVPAVIGQEVLRQRFGDLIWGFFEVDSSKGADGTGIHALKQEIARAAAQLNGMDLDYPLGWHAAQQAIRKIAKPAVPFREIVDVCRQHDLDADTADSLAQLLEVQGHAVYFPEAADDEVAGALADENIVVLDPEWLAKAVGFVIEDKETSHLQGLLKHSRLTEIWKRDNKRGCPGYKKELRGYVLWLMWKFDIAYLLDQETSLVPELIARNRPDTLYWTPDDPAQGREVRAVCVLTSKQTGKLIAFPRGLMPALTAAIHPLRVRRAENDPDQLDRNWNNGFFLSTQNRGAAFVELLDRELRMTVRHEYPALLLNEVQRTLENLIPQRWEHALADLRVPCLGKVNGNPCPNLFKKSWLGNQTPASTISCQECGRSDIRVSDLLKGFDPQHEEIQAQLRAIRDGQQELIDGHQNLLAVAYSVFRALHPENQERLRGPSLFTILPEKGGWVSGLTHNSVRLTCWCEHPDGPHPGSPIGSDEAPDYVLTVPKEWLVKVSPYISWAVTLLKAFTPLAGNVAGQIAVNASGIDIKDAVSTMKDMAGALPSGKLELGESRSFESHSDRKLHDDYRLRDRPEFVALKHIHDLLEEQVPKPRRWGKLRPVLTKTGDILWLCEQHAAIQSPPPQQL